MTGAASNSTVMRKGFTGALQRVMASDSAPGMLLVATAALAMLIANSPWASV